MKRGPFTIRSDWRDYLPEFRYWNEGPGMRGCTLSFGARGADPLWAIDVQLPDTEVDWRTFARTKGGFRAGLFGLGEWWEPPPLPTCGTCRKRGPVTSSEGVRCSECGMTAFTVPASQFSGEQPKWVPWGDWRPPVLYRMRRRSVASDSFPTVTAPRGPITFFKPAPLDDECPSCGHAWSSHPLEPGGSRLCRRAIGELPSCRECAAFLSKLDKASVPGPPLTAPELLDEIRDAATPPNPFPNEEDTE